MNELKNSLKNELKRVYKYKNISYKKYNMILAKIEVFKESDPFFYNYNIGKFITTFGKANEALPYLMCAKEFPKEEVHNLEASIYYNLYKCYVKMGKYQEAFESLYICKEKDKSNGDFSLALNMLASLVDMDLDFDGYKALDYTVENRNKIYFSELNYSFCRYLYGSIVETFNSKDYKSMVQDLKLLKSTVQENLYPIEVDSLVLLGEALKEKKENHYIGVIESMATKKMDLDEYLSMVKELLESGMPVKKFFIEADKYVNSDLDRAQAIYDLICSMGYPYYDVEKSYLKNAIREEKEYHSLPDSVKEKYDSLIEQGDKAYRARNFMLAKEKYREAANESMLSVSDYYIGKALFKQGKLGKAKEHFSNYALNGGSKYDKCLLYLGVINNIFNKKSVAKKQFRLMERLNDSFERDFVYEGPGSSYAIKNRMLDPEFDRYKSSVSKDIKMEEEDFITEEAAVDPGSFYDCDLDGKLSIIRNFLRHGQTDIANHLLEDIGPVYNFGDIDKVNQFQRNKKIYMNQKRTD